MPAAFPGLFWILGIPALAIIAAPVLIHLINMLRHRRVEWAAMEFLLMSQKKNRTWIVLKQLLLLLMRMTAVAAVVFLVAQPKLRDQWGQIFGTATTHHVVLLDDSYSMSDRAANTTAFEEAKKAVKELARKAVEQNESQTFTILRFSQAGGAGKRPDLAVEAVPPASDAQGRKDFLAKIDTLLAGMEVSQLAVGPTQALEEVPHLVGTEEDARRVVYLFTDLRARDWEADSEVQERLADLAQGKADVRVIYCVEEERPNLAITELAYAGGIPAAKVGFRMRVTVRNFGKTAAENVKVLRKTTTCLDRDGQTIRTEHPGSPETIVEIKPGEAVSKEFEVKFEQAGEHEVAVWLEGHSGDAIAADNFRYSAVAVPTESSALLVDCQSDARGARDVEFALMAGLRRRDETRDVGVPTGAWPQIQRPRFLTNAPQDDIRKFQSIFLLNVDHLDESAVRAVENYVREGGGAAIFVGENTLAKTVNAELYRDGQGLFPVPLKLPEDLKADYLERVPDIRVQEKQPHPIFAVEGALPALAMVEVRRYFGVADGWKPKSEDTRIVAWLRNGAPLVVEKRFGKGKVLAFLTTASPVWNDWMRNPTFITTLLELHQYLAERPWPERLVGSSLPLPEVEWKLYGRVELFAPGDRLTPKDRIDQPEAGEADSAAAPAKARDAFDDLDRAGVYEMRLFRRNDTVETRRYAVNVDPREGNLELASRDELRGKIEGLQIMPLAEIQFTTGESEAHRLREWLLYFLVALLLLEMVLAWSCSYHPSSRPLAPAKGGAQ